MPGKIFHAAESQTERRAIQAGEDLPALQPRNHKLQETAEKRSDHQRQKERESPVIAPALNRLHGVPEVEKGERQQSQYRNRQQDLPSKEKGMRGLSKRFTLHVGDTK